jgi:hypothetical protein
VEIQGPFEEILNKDTPNEKPGLRFLHKPEKSSMIHVGEGKKSKSLSASHTINGHSIALRLSYGNVRFSLTGDLNQESMAIMREHLKLASLEAEIVKAPHHGSADFDMSALKAMSPVVSLISSGDENSRKEHIHPRATLMAALGKASRIDTAIILCTELVAFFEKRDYSHMRSHISDYYKNHQQESFTKQDLTSFYKDQKHGSEDPRSFYAFERTNFGIIHVRTDGERVLVFTHSGKDGMREAYSFTVDGKHQVSFNKTVVTT